MPPNYYPLHSAPRCTGTFTKQSDGSAVDPGAVYCMIRSPDGLGGTTEVTYLYGRDVQLVRAATGVYYVDLNGAIPGSYFYEFWSTAPNQAGGDGWLIITPTQA